MPRESYQDLAAPSVKNDILSPWRERIFFAIFLSVIVMALAPYIFSVIQVIDEKRWGSLFSYTLGYLCIITIVWVPRIPFRIRVIIGLGTFYLLGMTALLSIGLLGSGRLWLFAFSIIASLLMGLRAGLITMFINAGTLFILGYLLAQGQLEWASEMLQPMKIWTITSLTFLFLNTVITVSLSLLVRALERQLLQEQKMTQKLATTNKQLEQDQKKRRIAEDELLLSEERLSLAIKGADIGMWDWNIEAEKATYSERWATMLGYELWELAPDFDTFKTLVHPEDIDRIMEALTRHFENNDFEYNVDFRLKTKSGSWKWINARGRVFDRDKSNKPLRMVITHIDITERINLQKQFIQAQKMESVGRLAGGVAHDYNNISSIILGYSELALEKVDQGDPLHEDLMEIFTAAKRSTEITRQLLAFARQQTIAPMVLDLNETIGNMLKMLRRLIGEDINLAWLPGDELWPIKIDPSQVDQILANLCVNARDAISDVGKITIETKNISFDEDYCAVHEGFNPGEYVTLTVSDNGNGIAPEILDKIFEPFFTTKKLGKGTGLGLSTVYGIVKQNVGFINIYSEPKQGTTINIYLPRNEGQAVKAHSENTIEAQLSQSETVLLVEDDEPILKLGKRILEELGYAVLSFASPAEAAKLAEEQVSEIDLLITDVVMPGMNGRELSEYLQHLYPNLKTLFMSGYTADVIAHRGVLEDGVSFISKPFSKKDLAAKVRDVLDEGKEQNRS